MPTKFTRRELLAVAGAITLPQELGGAPRSKRSFAVLGLLHPASLYVQALGTARLHCSSSEASWIVEGPSVLSLTCGSGPVRIAGPASDPVGCVFEIPKVMRRSYFGTFEIFSEGGLIVPVVTMDCENATGSIVAAEMPVKACAPNALAAQAVVSRSILCARSKPRHRFADFCDTTHCQFLRSPATPGSTVDEAIEGTRGMLLFQRERVFPARYSAACGGLTEAGTDGDFEYVPVPCEICRKGEKVRRGHGWGLCQEGAMGLAQLGWTWRAIVAKYYPNTSVGCETQSYR